MELLFYISVGFVAYTYVGYPLIIVIWGTLFPRRVSKKYQHVPLSVVVAAKNEEINIKARIDNLLSQDYPRDMVQIIVVSDGSTDRTAELARSAGESVIVIETDGAVGKAAALNLGLQRATNEIVVFADARQRFSDNAFAELAAMFNDETVGAVSGELIIESGVGSEVGTGVGLYWQYEKLIRRMESASGSVVGATGSIYAIRRALYEPLAEHTVLDDFLIPMRIVLRGYRVVFVRSARAYDISSATTGEEFSRKVRTLAGNFQAVSMEKRLLHPRLNPVFFQFVSHKLARLVVPYFCITALVTSLILPGAFFNAAFAVQAIFYLLGILNQTPLGSSPIAKPLRVAWTFIVLNAAAVVGLWVYITRRDDVLWKKS